MRVKLRAVRGHHIWPAPLGPNSIVVDAGAYRGQFSATLITDYGCRSFLIEANPVFVAALEIPGAAAIISGALAARDGATIFLHHSNPESGSIIPGPQGASVEDGSHVEGISLATLMERFRLSQIDLLKLDIEGAEFELLETTPDAVLRAISQITVEFHDFQARFARRALFEKARDRMHKLGFVCCVMSFRTHGDVLFLNRKRLRLSRVQSYYFRYAARWFSKFGFSK